MSEKKEFCSHSLKDAIAIAAADFGVEEDKIQYEIVTEKTKYFGHSRREIFILAWPIDGREEQAFEGFVKELLDLMKLSLSFKVSDGKGFLKIDFSGDDYKLMLYQNGNLLNAVQYLLNRLYSDSVGKKIYCECQNFRKNREQELTHLAHRHAKDVQRKGMPVNIKGLNPFERRIVHLTINKYNDLESKSDGESFQKVITIRKVDG